MASEHQRYEGCSGALPALDTVIQALDLAKSSCGIVPAQAAFASVGTLLATVRVRSLLSPNNEPRSRLPRTPQSTKKTPLSSGCTVPIFAKFSTVD